MPRKIIHRFLPDIGKLLQRPSLRWINSLTHDPNLLHLNRHSVSLGVFVGIFCAFIPLPIQTLIAAAMCFWLGANLPIGLMTIWISNPLTMAPMFYANYKFGAWMLNSPSLNLKFEWSAHWFVSQLHLLWKPLFAGSFVSGIVFALLAYYLVQLIWSWRVKRNCVKRKL